VQQPKPCVVCGNPLPTGGRIDRKYCREACRVMAYRDRHRLDKPEPSVASDTTTEGSQLEPTAKRPERATRLSNELESAIARIADLESQGRALRQRANSLELQLEATQRRLSTVEAVLRQMRTKAQQPGGTQTAATGPSVPPSQKTLPWMIPSSHDLLGYVPKWPLLDQKELTKIEHEAEQALRMLPVALIYKGLSDIAVQIRQCEQRPDRLLQQVNRTLVRRIACIEKTERATEEQTLELLDRVLADIECPHPSEGIMDLAAWTEFFIQYRQAVKMIAFMHINQLPSPRWALDLPA
jgi:DNA repair exonuclease SbcCD ATPase subunit